MKIEGAWYPLLHNQEVARQDLFSYYDEYNGHHFKEAWKAESFPILKTSEGKVTKGQKDDSLKRGQHLFEVENAVIMMKGAEGIWRKLHEPLGQ
jgi:hypothetical protein